MQLLSHTDQLQAADLQLGNDADFLSQNLQGVQTIELHFPSFTDGRAFSQALMLRRRCGFSSAVLRADQSLAKGRELLSHFSAFYQGDVAQPQPLFAR